MRGGVVALCIDASPPARPKANVAGTSFEGAVGIATANFDLALGLRTAKGILLAGQQMVGKSRVVAGSAGPTLQPAWG